MTTPAQIVLVGAQEPLFRPVEDGLRERGYEVVRYRSEQAFLTSNEGTSRASVLYAVSTLPVTRERMATSPLLRAVICPYTGTEGFDEKAATELGILIGNGQPPENYESMAEATILVVLACLYELFATEAHMRAGWKTRRPFDGHMLKGKTLGLVGFGQIARAMALRLQHWGAALQAYAPRLHRPFPDHVKRVEFEELLRTSDVICLTAGLNAQTRHMMNEKTLAMTKKGVILVNTARGGLIHEAALVALAKTGHFGKIALDVYETEPLPQDSPLRQIEGAILTPHAIGHTAETMKVLQKLGVQNCINVLEGKPTVYVRNPEVLPVWEKRWQKKT